MRARAAVPQLGCSIGAATLIFIPMLVSADPNLTAALSHIASSAVACALVAVAGATYLAQRDVAPPAALAPALLVSFVASSLVYALRLDVTTSIAGDALGWVSRLIAWMSLAALGPLWVFPAGGGAEGLRASRLAFMEMVGLLVLFTLGVAAHVCMAGAVAEGTLDQSGRLGFVVAAFALAMSWPCLSRLLSRMRLAPGAPQDGAQCDAEAWGQAHAIERLDGAERLTGRERSVLGLLSEGRAQAQVAAQLGISPSTVSTYRARALRKLGLPADCDLRHLGTKDAAPVVHPAVRVSRVAPLGGFLLPLACVLLGALLEGLSLS
ncbi:MAG: LuxR C-terminal-related transcriptional regulator [Olsenella sp.]